MKYFSALFLFVAALPFTVHASMGKTGFDGLKQCIMQNDVGVCHKVITPESNELADRFISYKLMPCLPTDYTYESEEKIGGFTVVHASVPAPDHKRHIVRLAFTGTQAYPRFDLPQTLRIGFGENWQNKIQMAESLYLMLKANAGNNLTCDQLEALVPKK